MSALTRLRLPLLAFAALCLYATAFVVIHRSSTLRRPAYNLMYWYYSDNPALEAIEFYSFWPLRQAAYRIPGFGSRHIRERTWQTQEMPPGFSG